MVSKRERLKPWEYFIEKKWENIAMGELEWKTPGVDTHRIFGNYKININWEVIGQTWNKMTYHFRKSNRSPFVALQINTKDNEWVIKKKQKEIKITKLMALKFKAYIKWYSEMRYEENDYILVPQDWNWNNMKLNNLEYVKEAEYQLNWTKKWIISHLISIINDKSDYKIAEILWISRSWANKLKMKLKKEWKIWHPELNNLIIANKTYPIYLILLEYKWEKSNLELAKELRPDENFKDQKNKERLTNKFVRVRKKLINKWLIKKYNTYWQNVNIADVQKELQKLLHKNQKLDKTERKTHEEIAKTFWLNKGQVDNFSRKPKQTKKKQ